MDTLEIMKALENDIERAMQRCEEDMLEHFFVFEEGV